jgi:S1-C subfamily serine protease
VSGVLILRALKNGAATAAGLRGTRRGPRGRLLLGDIIVGIEGDKVGSTNDLLNALEKHKVGDRVTVHVIRDERPMSLPVTLQAVG